MKFSIVTISFNQAQFLEQTILSVLSQDYDDIEYIVVDPGSTDGSRDIIERYRSRFTRVVYEPDKGPADGLNKGFALATGEILGFLNSDDILLPGAIRRAAEYMAAHPKIDVVSAHTLITDEAGKVIRKSYSDRMSLTAAAYGAAVLMQQSTFFRASCYRALNGFNLENRVAWDGELFIDMAMRGAQFALVNEFWSEFRLHSESITSSMRLDLAYRNYRKNIFQKIIGRPFRAADYFFVLAYRLQKHARNPLGLYERLTKGPIYGRSASKGLQIRSLLGRSITKDLREIKKSGFVRRNLANPFTPLARWLAFQGLHLAARMRVWLPLPDKKNVPAPAIYIVGSGRSGTTILGEVLEAHKSIHYLFEPVYLWRVICNATDVTEFFGDCNAKAILGAEYCDDATRQRFIALTRPGLLAQQSVLLEKTPHNAWRIGFLEALTPNSKYIHMVRDGIEVANSIMQVADRDGYRVAFMANHNTWWGVNDAKWRHLVDDCVANDYFADEIHLLKSNFQRGALEWIVSLLEVEKWEERLGERLLVVKLDDLQTHTIQTLSHIAHFLSIKKDVLWLRDAKRAVMSNPNQSITDVLYLPPKLCAVFNDKQKQFGFAGRASSMPAEAIEPILQQDARQSMSAD
jgi:glycosyltransferase involved in cell wall biosynthesis